MTLEDLIKIVEKRDMRPSDVELCACGSPVVTVVVNKAKSIVSIDDDELEDTGEEFLYP